MKPKRTELKTGWVLGRAALRAIDTRCANEYRLPTIALMENAGAAVAARALQMLRGAAGRRVLVVCGKGNNGGDGLVAARHLHNTGVAVQVVLAAPSRDYRGDAAVQLRVVERMGIPIMKAVPRGGGGVSVLVDALFGTGLDRPVSGTSARLIAAMNRLRESGGTLVLAVDLPSGMDADSGELLGPASSPCVRADVTVTLVARKPGFAVRSAKRWLGRVYVADIGVPAALIRQFGKARRAVG